MIFLFTLGLIMGSSLFAETSKSDERFSDRQIRVENSLRPKVLIAGEPQIKANILERMKAYDIPGVSLAVVNDYKVDWSQGYGHVDNIPESPSINEHTLFQAGSVSKPFTAFGALLLVQQGKISLDDDVNLHLKRWKVPENEFTKTEKVTLRRLLSHTAGTSVSGFSGYSVNTPLPSIVDILQGKKPLVNSDPVIVISKPGTEMNYSGGGTTIVQLLIEEITGESFDVWMQKNVLKPLSMEESTFVQVLPPALVPITAHGHHLNGVAVEGHWHIYPEMGAAGLWTTPNDLAKFMIYIQTVLKGEKTEPLHPEYVKEMITRQKIDGKEIESGLGFFLENYRKDLAFFHMGQDEGFITRFYGYAYRGLGVIIMMNNDSGWTLMDEITNSVADIYGWPLSAPIEKRMVSIDPSVFTFLQGEYVNKESVFEVSLKEGKLWIDFKNGIPPMELLPSGKCMFFMREVDAAIEFSNCSEKPESLQFTDSKKTKTTYKRK